jgi:predicted ArsR family transcriptional regulator
MQFRSPNQKHIYNFYERYMNENQYAPTLQEVSDALGMTPLTVRRHRQQLVEDGYMTYIAGNQRSAVLCPQE